MAVRGVLFDLDGTVVETSYDWIRIKRELGSEGTPILSMLESLPEPERSRKRRILERHEEEQTRKAVLKRGIPELLAALEARGIRTALITNNSRKNTEYLLEKFGLRFDAVLTRETGLWKPSGKPLLESMRRLGLDGPDCVSVGDSRFDVQAAREAGVPRIFILGAEGSTLAGDGVEAFEAVSALQARIEELAVGREESGPNDDA